MEAYRTYSEAGWVGFLLAEQAARACPIRCRRFLNEFVSAANMAWACIRA
jgi:hypothetical protein